MALILVIDDDEAVRFTLQDILENEGHQVSLAENGLVGEFRCLNETPDLAIIDMLMPQQEGIETIAHIKRRWPSLPIIAISGGGRVKNLDFLRIAVTAGAEHTLSKPFTPDAVIAAVRASLASR